MNNEFIILIDYSQKLNFSDDESSPSKDPPHRNKQGPNGNTQSTRPSDKEIQERRQMQPSTKTWEDDEVRYFSYILYRYVIVYFFYEII